MGWQATGWAFKAPIDNSGCKFVLVALAERAGNEDDESTWYCFPSINKICEYTAQGYRTVQRHLNWLEENGYITRTQRVQSKGRRGAFNFTLNPFKLATGQIGHRPENTNELDQNGQTEPVIGTGQEKAPRARTKPGKFCPDDWQPNEKHTAKAEELCITPEQWQTELEKFREFEFRDPKTDWDRTFHRWLRQAAELLKRDDHARGATPAILDRGAAIADARVSSMVGGARKAAARWKI